MTEIRVPDNGLVVLVGVTGSGKSHFARKHFKSTQVVSSDYCRGVVSDDENDQSATADAFELLHYIVAKRLRRGLLTVVDANVERYPALRRAHQAELRMLAVTSGLAEPHEPHDEAARIGATLVALLRHRDTVRSSNRTTTAERWLRRLGRLASSA